MSSDTIGHLIIAVLNVAAAVVSWIAGRRQERARIMRHDRRQDPRYEKE